MFKIILIHLTILNVLFYLLENLPSTFVTKNKQNKTETKPLKQLLATERVVAHLLINRREINALFAIIKIEVCQIIKLYTL